VNVAVGARFTGAAGTLSGATINGELRVEGRVRIAGGSTFTTARLSGSGAELLFLSGESLTGTIFTDGPRPFSTPLVFSNGTYSIAPTGVIRTDASSGAGLVIMGHTLANAGRISSQAYAVSLSLDASTFTNSGTLEVKDGGILNFGGGTTWTNPGTVALSSGGLLTMPGFFDARGGIGTWSNSNAEVRIMSGSTILNTGNTLTLNSSTGSWRLFGGTISGGTLAFADGRTLDITPIDSNRLLGVTVDGGLNVGNGRVRIGAGTTFKGARLAGGTLTFEAGSTITGPISGAGTIETSQGSVTLTLAAGAVIRTEVGVVGNLTIASGASDLTLRNEGLVSSQVSGQTLRVSPSEFSNAGTLEVRDGGILSIAPFAAWTNAGTIEVGSGSIFHTPIGYTQTAGVTRLANGTLEADGFGTLGTVIIASGRLEGRGTIRASGIRRVIRRGRRVGS